MGVTEGDEGDEGADEGQPEGPGVSPLEPSEAGGGEVEPDDGDSHEELHGDDGVDLLDEVLPGRGGEIPFFVVVH